MDIATAMRTAPTKLEHLCNIDYEEPVPFGTSTSIIATFGPAWSTPEMVEKMIAAGMTIVRFNMSYGSPAYYTDVVKMLRRTAKAYSHKVGYDIRLALAIDPKGPEIRTGNMDPNGPPFVQLVENQFFTLTIVKDYAEKGSGELIYVDYPNIVNVMKPQGKICLDDGYISLTAVEVNYDNIKCVVDVAGMLRDFRNVILPGVDLDVPALSEKDLAELKFAMQNEFDIVIVPFVRSAKMINEIRKIVNHGNRNFQILAKIENRQGLRNFDSILEAADGIVFMRCTVGMEMDGIQVMISQKMVLAKCRRALKPGFVATQLAVSMINKPTPNRREVYDIANSIMDGANGVALSSATSVGSYPVEVIEVVTRCSRQVQPIYWPRSMFRDLAANLVSPVDAQKSTIVATMEAAIQSGASAIINISMNGNASKVLSAFRPHCPIVVVVQTKQCAKQLNLYGGLYAFPYKDGSPVEWSVATEDDRLEAAIDYCRRRKFVKNGRPVVIVNEVKLGLPCSIRIFNI